MEALKEWLVTVSSSIFVIKTRQVCPGRKWYACSTAELHHLSQLKQHKITQKTASSLYESEPRQDQKNYSVRLQTYQLSNFWLSESTEIWGCLLHSIIMAIDNWSINLKAGMMKAVSLSLLVFIKKFPFISIFLSASSQNCCWITFGQSLRLF